MKYYSQVGLTREPFSNSPDPNFLYYSRQHISCLQELEIAVRLKRGLNVILGDVGTGKTTLCRRFVRNMGRSDSISLHLLLDPYFKKSDAFLRVLCTHFTGEVPEPKLNSWQLKERIKKALLKRGVKENRTTVLILDEGQKITDECLEILRELLNYETNESKLLQIVIFAQRELEPVIRDMSNFMDRINLFQILTPLKFRETRAMILYRLDQAAEGGIAPKVFTRGAMRAIYRATGGYPRKVVRLCHKIVLAMCVAGKNRADRSLAMSCIRDEKQLFFRSLRKPVVSFAALLLVSGAGYAIQHYYPEVRDIVSGPAKIDVGAVEYAITPSRLSLREGNIPEPGLKLDMNLSEDGVGYEQPALAVATRPSDPAVVEPVIDDPNLDIQDVPSMLGEVALKDGDDVAEFVQALYGCLDDDVSKAVLRANKGLNDMDKATVGDKVRFPFIEKYAGNKAVDLIWVRLAETDDLDEACEMLRQYAFFGLSMRLVPYCVETGVVRFAVVEKRPYQDSYEALQSYYRLPLSLQAEASLFRIPSGAISLGKLTGEHVISTGLAAN